MESDLDEISSGEKAARPWLKAFYFGDPKKTVGEKGHLGLKQQVGDSVGEIDARMICTVNIGETDEGEPIAARVGRYGPYIQLGDSDRRAPIPDGVLPDQLDKKEALRLLELKDQANRPLGEDPESGKTIHLKTGAYGPYVQLGEPELTPKGNLRKGGKPKMASLWPSMSVDAISLDQALILLSYPKILGRHPQTSAEVVVQDGKFGPYVQMYDDGGKRQTRSLKDHDHLATINLGQAVELLAQPRPRGRATPAAVAQLGESEVTKQQIEVRVGRFGPYVTDGQVNATIPRGRDPSTVTLETALELIAQREQKMRDQGKDPRAPKGKKAAKKKAAKKAPAKKAAKKKAAKKKAAKKKTAKKKTAKKKTTKKKASKKAAPKKKAASE